MAEMTSFLEQATAIAKAQGGKAVNRFLKKFTECHQCGMAYRKTYRCVTCRPVKKKTPGNTNKARYAALKDSVFNAYGGYSCVCCGESIKTFLTIDHINNDGAKHRQTISKGFYYWLRDNHFPAGFQVLCYNCNIAKFRNHGVCPHQEAVQKVFHQE